MLYPLRVQITWWLAICALLVFCMVILGGAVRVTGSGLSMVDWKPLLGILPPLGEFAWREAFDQYKQSPEGSLVNADISLADFQFIFFMEYFHRMLGRLVGLVFFLPFCYFLLKGGLSAALRSRLWLLLLLGALQGLMGWYMVQSGLVDDPHVSQYRLTAHLLLAILIFVIMVRLIVGLWVGRSRQVIEQDRDTLARWSGAVLVLTLIMIASGGFMAGTHAGHIYNTWPLMGEQLMPDMLMVMTPWWLNLAENAAAIQFVHRWLAWLVAIAVVAVSAYAISRDRRAGLRLFALLAILLVFVQIGLGIATLVSGVPPLLAVMHQGNAVALAGVVTTVWSFYLRSLATLNR